MNRDPEKARAWQQRSVAKAQQNARSKPRAQIRARSSRPSRVAHQEAVAVACREAIERDGRVCQALGILPGICWGPLDPQHVIPQGASREQATNPENIIAVCRSMHEWLHAHPLLSQSMGLSIPRHAVDVMGADRALAAAAELRYHLRCDDPAFAPWLSGAERDATALQDQRWLYAPTLEDRRS